MAKIILSAFSDEYADGLDEQIKILTDNSFDMIEPRFIDKVNISDITDAAVKELDIKLKANGLKVSSLGSPLGKINLADNFDEHLEKTKRTVEIANELGTKYIRAFSFYLREGKTRDDEREEVIDKLGRMIDVATSGGVTLCHENEAKIYGESPDRCLDLLETFGGRLKAVFDMGNFVLDGFNALEAYEMLKEHIAYFHIKDSLSQGAIVPAGKGEAQIAEILSAYKREFDRDFVITLEPHLQTFSGLNALVGKTFENPYKYEDQKSAFEDAIIKLKEII